MEKALSRRSSIFFAVAALILFIAAGMVFLVKVPASFGGAIETNAAARVNFEPGAYQAKLNMPILSAPDGSGVQLGTLSKGQPLTVYEVHSDEENTLGRIAPESDNWVVLQDSRIIYAVQAGE